MNQDLYQERLQRLKRMIELKAPTVLIWPNLYLVMLSIAGGFWRMIWRLLRDKIHIWWLTITLTRRRMRKFIEEYEKEDLERLEK